MTARSCIDCKVLERIIVCANVAVDDTRLLSMHRCADVAAWEFHVGAKVQRTAPTLTNSTNLNIKLHHNRTEQNTIKQDTEKCESITMSGVEGWVWMTWVVRVKEGERSCKRGKMRKV